MKRKHKNEKILYKTETLHDRIKCLTECPYRMGIIVGTSDCSKCNFQVKQKLKKKIVICNYIKIRIQEGFLKPSKGGK